MKLIPRQEKFYEFFREQARLTTEATGLLAEAVRLDQAGATERFQRISELERKGDTVIQEVAAKLRHTFITPIDPEDIHRLAERLDDILNGIEKCAFRVMAYNVQPAPDPFLELADLGKRACDEVANAVEALASERPVDQHCDEITRIESKADQVFRNAELALFADHSEAIALLKQVRILDRLEKITDRCEDAGDVIENISVKNS